MIFMVVSYLITIVLYFLAAFITICVLIKSYLLCTTTMCTCTTKLDGKIVIVTGGNTGIGFMTAKRLAKHGARVIIASRNLKKSEAAVERIKQETGNSLVEAKPLDLSRLTSVKEFAEDFNKSFDRLDILVNNAGTNDGKQEITEDGIEKVMQVNHFGPTYLTYLLLDKLVATKSSRIVFVGSNVYKFHRFDPNDLRGLVKRFAIVPYANSKFCTILAAKTIAKRYPDGPTANAVHPGGTESEIWNNIPNAIARKIFYLLLKLVFKSINECAQTSIHCALAPSLEGVTGQYFDECKKISVTRSYTDELAERVWDDTIKIANDAVQNKTNKLEEN